LGDTRLGTGCRERRAVAVREADIFRRLQAYIHLNDGRMPAGNVLGVWQHGPRPGV
jgi:hypothetical protein